MTARRVSFEAAQFPRRQSIGMEDFSALDLRMNVDTVVRSVQPDKRREILRLIEASAKARGDLSTANNAHYAQNQYAPALIRLRTRCSSG